jgi:hypothetical protein
MVRLGDPAVRAGLLPLKGPPRIPDPGQYVELRTEDGSWRWGFRAITEPSTSEWGEVVVWVATEDEYRAAQREGRSAVGVPWPTERMVVSSSGLPWRLPHPAGCGAWVHIPTEDGEERIAEVCFEGDRWKTDGPPLVELLEVLDATGERLREGSLSEAC